MITSKYNGSRFQPPGGEFEFSFDENTGALNYLYHAPKQILLANDEHQLSHFMYQSYNKTDFDVFNADYNKPCGGMPE